MNWCPKSFTTVINYERHACVPWGDLAQISRTGLYVRITDTTAFAIAFSNLDLLLISVIRMGETVFTEAHEELATLHRASEEVATDDQEQNDNGDYELSIVLL